MPLRTLLFVAALAVSAEAQAQKTLDTVRWKAPRGIGDLATFVELGGQPSVLVIDGAGKALVLRDAVSGKVRWRTAAPGSVIWHHHRLATALSPDGPHALLHGKTQQGDVQVGVVRLRDGALLWHRQGEQLAVGTDGTGLAISGWCGLQAVDVASGKPRGPALHGARMHLYRRLGGPHDTVCRDHPRLLGERGGQTLMARVQRSRDPKDQSRLLVEAYGSGDAPRWSFSLHRFSLRSLGLVRGTDLLFGEGDDLRMWSVDPQSGRHRWSHRFDYGGNCPRGSVEPRPIVRDGKVDGVLVHDGCKRVLRLDPKSGARGWTREASDGVVIVGERVDADGDVNLPLHRPRHLRFITRDGQLAGEVPLDGARDRLLVPGGILLRSETTLSLWQSKGVRKWQRPLPKSSAAGRLGRFFWVRLSTTPASLLIVDSVDGAPIGQISNAEWAFGETGGLVVIGRRKPEEIGAVQVPGP